MPIEEPHLKRMAGDPWIYKLPPICPECGYNLTGLTSPRCPECGRVFHRKEVEQRARELSYEMLRLKDVNEVPGYGLKAVIGGFAFFGLTRLAGFKSVPAVVGILVGVLAVGLGLSVFRARRLPSSMIEELPAPPNYMLGVGVALLGILLIAVSILA